MDNKIDILLTECKDLMDIADEHLKELHKDMPRPLTEEEQEVKIKLMKEIAEHRTEQADIGELMRYFEEAQIEKLEYYTLKELQEIRDIEIN